MIIAAANGFVAVALGSFAAHGLHSYAAAELVPTWQTGVRYHMIHVVAALVAGLLARFSVAGGVVDGIAVRMATIAGWLFLGGILFFCGSLYLLVLAAQGWLSITAPLGGILLLLGWVSLTWSLISKH